MFDLRWTGIVGIACLAIGVCATGQLPSNEEAESTVRDSWNSLGVNDPTIQIRASLDSANIANLEEVVGEPGGLVTLGPILLWADAAAAYPNDEAKQKTFILARLIRAGFHELAHKKCCHKNQNGRPLGPDGKPVGPNTADTPCQNLQAQIQAYLDTCKWVEMNPESPLKEDVCNELEKLKMDLDKKKDTWTNCVNGGNGIDDPPGAGDPPLNPPGHKVCACLPTDLPVGGMPGTECDKCKKEDLPMPQPDDPDDPDADPYPDGLVPECEACN